jgi:hypothetical protein
MNRWPRLHQYCRPSRSRRRQRSSRTRRPCIRRRFTRRLATRRRMLPLRQRPDLRTPRRRERRRSLPHRQPRGLQRGRPCRLRHRDRSCRCPAASCRRSCACASKNRLRRSRRGSRRARWRRRRRNQGRDRARPARWVVPCSGRPSRIRHDLARQPQARGPGPRARGPDSCLRAPRPWVVLVRCRRSRFDPPSRRGRARHPRSVSGQAPRGPASPSGLQWVDDQPQDSDIKAASGAKRRAFPRCRCRWLRRRLHARLRSPKA